MQLETLEHAKSTLSPEDKYQIITSHIELGMKLAWKLLNSWQAKLPQDDVKSLVGISLCEAAQNYDGRPNVQFQTFLYYYLRGRLLREISESVKSKNVSRQFLCEDVDISCNAETAELSKKMLPTDSKNAEQLMIDCEEKRMIDQSLAVLDDLESEIIQRHYIDGDSLIDIAEALGYCRCHLSRVKRRALDKLRKAMVIQNDQIAPNVVAHSQSVILTKIKTEGYTGGRGRRKVRSSEISKNKLAA